MAADGTTVRMRRRFWRTSKPLDWKSWDLFREVRDAVLKSTGDKQEPFMYGSLSREKIYLTARAER